MNTKKYIIVDGVFEGQIFDGYILNDRIINIKTDGQSYPIENCRIYDGYSQWDISILDYINKSQEYIDLLISKKINTKQIYGTGRKEKAIELLKKRIYENTLIYKQYGNISIMKLEMLYGIYPMTV